MDKDQKDSWHSLTPEITHRDRPAVLAPEDISPFTTQKFPQSAKAGRYTKGQLSEILRCHSNEFSIEECLTEIYTKLDSPLKLKERP